MCGDHGYRPAVGGALAVLSSPEHASESPETSIIGRLLFHGRDDGESTATHAMFAPNSSQRLGSPVSKSLLAKIHETGDMRRPAVKSPCWATFRLVSATNLPEIAEDGKMEGYMSSHVRIEVGSDGIIGRRVSLWAHGASAPIAEGVIGYN
ncbi:hypothetical protein F5Y16DRAFT_393454 [Xylariaceae sp. FL0255]|nr:hypothetical protein F5Y16DRAFT_393454 [Xylariaceae sp. FL0255]